MIKRRRQDISKQSSNTQSEVTPLPTRRAAGERALHRYTGKLDQEAIDPFIQEAFEQRLVTIVESAIKSQARSNQGLTQAELYLKLQDTKNDLFSAKNIPRGILDSADRLGEFPPKTVSSSLGSKHNLRARWQIHVTESFAELLVGAWDQYQRYSSEELAKKGTSQRFPPVDRSRVTEAVLKSIIRPDLPEEHKTLFLERVGHTSKLLTNLQADMSALLRALMLQMARRGFEVNGNKKATFAANEVGEVVTIEDFLPATAVRDTRHLLSEEFIPIATIPHELKDISKADDLFKLFTTEHVQYIYTRYLSANETTDMSRRPLWEQLTLNNIPLERHQMPGLSTTISSANQQLGRSLQNIWSGGIFTRSLDRLLLVCLRAHLAPVREGKYLDMVKKKAGEAKERKDQSTRTPSRGWMWQRLRKEKKYREKCVRRCLGADLASSATWQERAQISQGRSEKLLRQLRDTKSMVSTSISMPEEDMVASNSSTCDEAGRAAETNKTDDEEAEIHIDRLIKAGIDVDDAAELAVGCELFEDFDDDDPNAATAAAATGQDGEEKDTTATRIRQFKVIVKKILLEKGSDSSSVISKNVKKAWIGPGELTVKESQCIVDIVRAVNPYMPPKDSPKDSVALHLPLVLLSNTVQRVAGYGRYARKISPYISPASIHGLQLDAVALFEMMGSKEVAQNFNVFNQHGFPITSAVWATQNKAATLGSFFDIPKITTLCAARGLEFHERLVIKGDGMADLYGELKERVQPATSYYEQRRSHGLAGPRRPATKFTGRQKQYAKNADATIKTIVDNLRWRTAQLSNAEKNVRKAQISHKGAADPAQRLLAYALLKQHRRERCLLQVETNNSDEPSHSASAPPPTDERPAHEDSAEHINVNRLLEEARHNGREVVFSGTDYGIVTMSTTVTMTMQRYNAHIALYNRFGVLGDDSMDVDSDEPNIAVPASDKCHRVTAGEIEQLSLTRQFARKRERRKKRNPNVMQAEKKLSEKSISMCLTPHQVFESHAVAKDQREVLRNFYYSSRAKRESRSMRLLKNRAYDIVASTERKHIATNELCTHKQTNRLIMCIGAVGTGVGTRIGGYLRRGGGQMRRRHRRYATVAITNEFRSSQTCAACFGQVVRPKGCRMVKGEEKLRSINGGSICYNFRCPSYRAGHNTRNRDAEAAKCIALAGVSRMLTGTTLPPFSPKSSQSYAAFTQYHAPPVIGAPSVPVNQGLR